MAEILKYGRFPILYRVKQGERDANGRPVKNDHLKVYRNVRVPSGYDLDTDIMEKLHKKYEKYNTPEKASVIPISLLFDDPAMNIRTHLACYKGNTVKFSQEHHTPFLRCKGNGAKAMRTMPNGEVIEVNCPGPDKCYGMVYNSNRGALVKLCKLQGVFDFMLRGLTDYSGGIARYRTAGFNSASFLLGQLQYFRAALGMLRGLPFNIELTQSTAQTVSGELFTFFSLMLSVEGEDPIKTLAEAKMAETLLRNDTGIDIEAAEKAFAWMKGDIESEEGEDEAGDAEYDNSDGDKAQYDDLMAESAKEKALADKQQTKIENGTKLRAAAQEKLQQLGGTQSPSAQLEPGPTQELPPASVPGPPIDKSASKRKVKMTATPAPAATPAADPNDPGPEDYFPDMEEPEERPV